MLIWQIIYFKLVYYFKKPKKNIHLKTYFHILTIKKMIYMNIIHKILYQRIIICMLLEYMEYLYIYRYMYSIKSKILFILV